MIDMYRFDKVYNMDVGRDLFNPDDSDLIGQSSVLALLSQLIVDLPRAEDQPLDL
jgi:hypothetical protein